LDSRRLSIRPVSGGPVSSIRNTFKRRSKVLDLVGLNAYSLRHKMATELAARKVSRDSIQRQLGHKAPDMRTTERYIKNDPRHLADAKEAIEEYLTNLNRLTDRNLLRPDTSKILLTDQSARAGLFFGDKELALPCMKLKVVGGTGIEPVAPSMSRKCSPAELTAPPAGRGLYSVGVRGGQAAWALPPEPAPSPAPDRNFGHFNVGLSD
jgi:hypothetical protein